jgi:hypothetical protein
LEPRGFIGERHDPETGLLYLHARHYDPVIRSVPFRDVASGLGNSQDLVLIGDEASFHELLAREGAGAREGYSFGCTAATN